jgi:hypothetical protein
MVVSCGILALAADIDGKWVSEVPLRGGNSATQTLTLKAAGDTLTGSLLGALGPVEISEGTIMDNAVAFKIVRQVNGSTIAQIYKGTLAGDELKLTTDNGRGRGRELTFTRAK